MRTYDAGNGAIPTYSATGSRPPLKADRVHRQAAEPQLPEILMSIRSLLATSLILSCLSVMPIRAAETVTSAVSASRTTTYKTVTVNGLNIFYREAGPSNAPAILLLHGFPPSPPMFATPMPLPPHPHRPNAPDYPRFRNPAAAPPAHLSLSLQRPPPTL